MRRLLPGLYVDGDAVLHLDLPELLALAGHDDTPERRAAIVAALRQVYPGARIHLGPDRLGELGDDPLADFAGDA